jgi:protein-tyrosine phosphatase
MSFFKKLFSSPEKPLPEPISFADVAVDMHSHFIPGIDDGAPTLADSVALIEAMAAFGFKKVITSPHIYFDLYKNTSAIVLDGLQKVKTAVAEAGIPIEVEAAAEYFLDEHTEELIERKELLTFGKNYVLFEISFAAEPANLGRGIFNMHLQGYKPIIAHPERYDYWHHDFSKYESLIDKDVLIQINTNCLTGQYGPGAKRICERLIDAGMVSFIGSDCHHVGHLQLLEQVRTQPYLKKLIESGKLLNHTLLGD